MLYPLMTLNDNTEIAFSDMIRDNNKKQVKVYVEQPVYGGFHNAWCRLPDYEWSEINGFTDAEIKEYTELIESMAHLIFRFAEQGGIGNAPNF